MIQRTSTATRAATLRLFAMGSTALVGIALPAAAHAQATRSVGTEAELRAAIDAANADTTNSTFTIRLAAPITVTTALPSLSRSGDRSGTLDLNGFALSGATTPLVTGGGRVAIANAAGTVTSTVGTAVGTSAGAVAFTFDVTNGGSIVGGAAPAVSVNATNALVANMVGGTIRSTVGPAVRLAGDPTFESSLVVTNAGTIRSADGAGIAFDTSPGINGKGVSGQAALLAGSTTGTVNFSAGGTVSLDGADADAAAASVGAIDFRTSATAGGSGTLNLRSGNGTIDLSTVSDMTVLNKQGTGTWTLTGASASPGATIAAGTSMGAGTGTPSAGVLVFDTTGLTGTINLQGATIRAIRAGAFGTGQINAFDPRIEYGATGTYANAIFLASSNPSGDPTVLAADAGVAATLTGRIFLETRSNEDGSARAAQPLVIDGAGAITLTNTANMWNGTTTINARATLIGTGATISGSAITNNGALVYDQGAGTTSSVAQAVSGAGTLTKQGSGTTTLSGANSYTGATTIADGTLEVLGQGVRFRDRPFPASVNTIAASSAVALTGANAVLAFSNANGLNAGTADIRNLSGVTGSRVTLAGGQGFGRLNVTTDRASVFGGTIEGVDGAEVQLLVYGTTPDASLTLTANNAALTFVQSVGAALRLVGAGAFANATLAVYPGETAPAAFDIAGIDASATAIRQLIGDGAVLLGTKTLRVTDGGSFEGVIAGSGGLTVEPTDDNGAFLALYGINTYTGATTIAPNATLALAQRYVRYDEATDQAIYAPASIAASSGVQADGTFDVTGNGPATTITSLTGGAGGRVLLGVNDRRGDARMALAVPDGATAQTLTISNASGTFAGVISDTTEVYDPETDTFQQVSTGSGVTIAGGTQVFTGANTYTGATTLDGGNLTLGDGGTTGSVAGPIALSGENGAGTLTFNRSDAGLVIAGEISGTGNLVQAGSGATTLAAFNSYTGSTTIADGTLIVADGNGGGITNSSAIALTGANAVLQFNSAYEGAVRNLSGVAGSRITFAPDADGNAFFNALSVTNSVDTVFGGTVTGAEAQEERPFGVQISKFGAGALTLTAANANVDYAFVGEGSLRLAGDGSLTNATVFLAGSETDLSFDVSGVAAPDTSIVDLSGGEGSSVLLGAKTLRISDARGGYNGVISGSGGLTIEGGPRLSLGGINTYTGATTIAAGATLGLTGTTTDRDPVTGQRGFIDGSIAASSGVQADGTFDAQYLNGDTTIRALTGAGTGQVLLGSTRFDETSQNFVVAPRTLTITNANGVFAGVISDTVFLSNNQTGFGSNVTSNSGVTIAGGTQVFTGANTYTGATTLAGGNLTLGDGGTAGSVAGSIALGAGTLTINRSNAVTLPGVISGTGNLVQAGTGTTTLTAVNTYTGTTGVNAGTLALAGNGSIAGSAVTVANGGTFSIAGRNGGTSVAGLSGAGQVALGANTLTLTNGGTFVGVASDTGGITVASGNQVFTGNNTYTGATTLNGGNLTLGDGGTTGAVAGSIALGAGTLTINRSNAVTLAGAISGTGSLVQAGAGMTTLTGANTYTGTTSVNAGTLALAGNGSLTSEVIVANGASFDVSGVTSGAITARGLSGGGTTALGANTLTLTAANDSYAGVVSGTGGLTVAGGRQVLTGTNTYTGATTVASGATLALGNGGTGGSVAGPIVANGTVDLNRSGDYTLADTVSGAGTVNKLGAGTTTLSGRNGAGAQFTGTANVNAGTLSIGGVFGDTAANAALVNVNAGGTLHGTGTIAGSVAVNNGGTVSAGNSPGTLTVLGNYTLNGGSNSLFELGTPDVVGGANNDLINVGGNLTLGGTLTLVNSLDATMALASGDYRLFNYGGTLAGSFAAINTGATDPAETSLDTGTAGQVNLGVRAAGQQVQYWDGTDTGAVRGPQGGSGIWNTTNANWTGENTTANRAWRSGVGIFGTTGGTVRIEDAQAFQGLQFTVNGYQLTGPGSLTMTGDPFTTADQSFVTVDANVAATIAAAVTGNGIGLVKYGAGNLILTGANSYTGTTAIAAGTLTGTTSSIVGSNIITNATLAYNQNASGTVAQAITGTGAVTVSGAAGATLTFAGNNAFTGAAGTRAAITSFGPGLVFTGTTTSVSDTIALTGANARLTVTGTGSLVSSGGNTVFASQAGATIANAGTIRTTFANGAAVFLAAGGTIANSGTIAAANGVAVFETGTTGTTTISNASGGTIASGFRAIELFNAATVTNAGTISGGTSTGALLRGGGSVDNAGTGVITGGSNGVTFAAAGTLGNAGRIEGATSGVAQNAAAGLTVTNSGTIAGGTAGVATNAGGTLTLTNAGSGTISGTQNNAVYTGTGSGTVTNAGLLTGGNAAVYADGALVLVNSGTIRNTTGGNAQAISGVYSSATNASITNSGLIDSRVNGGHAIKLDGGASSVTNLAGGTLAGFGGGAAVLLSGAGYTLDLRSGSTTTGGIDARATTGANALTLAGTLTGGYVGGSGGDAVTLVDSASFTGVLDGGAGVDTVTLTGTGNGTVDAGNLVRFESVAKTGTGRFTLSGIDASTADFQVRQGVLTASGGRAINDGALVDIANAGTLDLATGEAIGALAGAGAVTLGSNTLSVVGGRSTTFAGVISGAGGLTRAGTGTLTLSGANSYTGATTIGSGTLALGASNVLADASAVTVANGGTFDLGANTDTVASLVLAGTLNGTGTLNAASYTLTGGTANANLGAGTLTQASGTSTLNGTSAATTANVTGGTLALGASNRLADAAALTVVSGATLNLGAFNDTVGTAALSGTLAGTGTLTAASYALNGAAVNANLGAGTLAQIGGTSTLNGTSAATTVNVTGGTLVLGASERLADAAGLAIGTDGVLDLGAFAETVGTAAIAGRLNGTGTLNAASYTLTGGTANANLGAGTLTQASGASTLNGTSATATVNVTGGTLALGGANRLADAAALTVVSGATLNLGAFNDTVGTAALSGTLAGTGTLTAVSYALNGAAVNANLGAGTLTQIGGTSTLNGTSAATTVNVTGGTLVLGASERLADAAGLAIGTDGVLDLGAFAETVGTAAIAGRLSGTGTLNAASYTLTGGTANANLGAGTLTQASGASTLNGTSAATTANVTGGTLALGASNRLADAAAVTVVNGATLNLGAFNDTVGTATLSGTLAGTGTLTAASYALNGAAVNANLGAGTLTQSSGTSVLTGTSGATTVAVNSGTLRLGAGERLANTAAVTVAQGASFDLAGFAETVGSVAGAGTVALGAGSLTFGGTNTGTAFSGAVTGSGDLVKTGTGTLALAGNAASTARLVAAAGTIALSGTNGGSARIAGGTLTGTGATVGNLTLASGTLSPGTATTPIGTLQAGSLSVTGGTYIADIAGATGGFGSDLVRVTGAAALAGGTIAPRSTEATAGYRVSQTYTVVQAGTLSGQFANGTAFATIGNNADLQYRLRYDLVPNAVLLEVRRQVDFTAGLGTGATENQRALGAALNGGAFTASDDFARTLNAIQALSPAQTRASFDLIGGEAASATTTLVGLAGDRYTDLIRGRLATATGAGAGGQTLASLGGSDSRTMRAAAGLGDGASTLAGSSDGNRVAVWLQGHGADGTLQGRGGTATVQSYAAGIVGGIEARLGAITIGAAGMVDDVEAKLRSRQSRSTGTLYQGGGYLAFDDGRFFTNAVGSYFKADVDTARQVYVGSALIGRATGTTDSDGYTLGGAMGYRLGGEEGLRVAPQIAGRMVSVTRDAYTETGAGGLSLASAREERELFTATGEVRLSHKTTGAGGSVEPWASVGLQRMWGDRDAFTTNRITGAPIGTGTFRVDGAALPEWAGLLGGGIEAKPTERVTLGASAESTLSGRYKESRLSLRVRLGF